MHEVVSLAVIHLVMWLSVGLLYTWIRTCILVVSLALFQLAAWSCVWDVSLAVIQLLLYFFTLG